MKIMELCGECSMLKQRLQRANDHYIRLIFQLDRMTRDGNARTGDFENVMQEAQNRLISAGRELLSHRGTHEDLSRPKTRTAGQL